MPGYQKWSILFKVSLQNMRVTKKGINLAFLNIKPDPSLLIQSGSLAERAQGTSEDVEL